MLPNESTLRKLKEKVDAKKAQVFKARKDLAKLEQEYADLVYKFAQLDRDGEFMRNENKKKGK